MVPKNQAEPKQRHNAPYVQLESRLRDMEAAMCCTVILQRSSLFIKGIMHAATSRRSRICKGPVTRTWGESAHLVLHCDAEGPGNNGAVDTGHDERGGQGKGSRGDNPTADCRTTNGEGDAHLCPGVQASPSVRQAWERTSVAASFRVERARSHTS